MKERDDDKPLLPYIHSPSSSRSSSPPPSSPVLSNPLASASAFLASKRRWLAVGCVYLLLTTAWYNGLHSAVWERASLSRFSWRALPGDRLVYDAQGRPFPVQSLPIHVKDDLTATTSLGPSADAVFHLFPPISSPSPAVLLSTLESFLVDHFPAADFNTSDPTSLINDLRSFFPSPSQPPASAQIPHTIWQTAPNAAYRDQKKRVVETWQEAHPDWDVVFHDNEAADEWVRNRFDLKRGLKRRDEPVRTGGGDLVATKELSSSIEEEEEQGQRDGFEPEMEKGVIAAWDRLTQPAVLRSDFWRYLVLAVEGGVYADTDVECLKPVGHWSEDVSWKGVKYVSTLSNLPPLPPADEVFRQAGRLRPRLPHRRHRGRRGREERLARLVAETASDLAVDDGVGARSPCPPRHRSKDRRVLDAANGGAANVGNGEDGYASSARPPLTHTRADDSPPLVGPGPFTDAVLSYLLSQYRKPWGALRGLSSDGWRFRASEDAPELLQKGRKGKKHEERWGDVKVLCITGFSPGVGCVFPLDPIHPPLLTALCHPLPAQAHGRSRPLAQGEAFFLSFLPLTRHPSRITFFQFSVSVLCSFDHPTDSLTRSLGCHGLPPLRGIVEAAKGRAGLRILYRHRHFLSLSRVHTRQIAHVVRLERAQHLNDFGEVEENRASTVTLRCSFPFSSLFFLSYCSSLIPSTS